MKTIKITVILIILLNFKISAITYTSIGCPGPVNWSGFTAGTCLFWNGGTQLTSQPAAGDILVIPAGCTVTITGNVSVTNPITLNIYGHLKFGTPSDQLNLNSSSQINVFSGGSISGPSPSNQIKLGTGIAEWSGPGTSTGPFFITDGFLPIELVYFVSNLNVNNQVNIGWQTATESNNDFFVVERSANGIDFIAITEIKSQSESGNSLQTLNYEMTDFNTLTGTSYYRLKQVDFNGHFTYSNIESIEGNASEKIKIVPNPVDKVCTIEFETENSVKQVEIYNSIAQIVKTVSLNEQTQKTIQLDFSNMTPGIYYLKADGIIFNQKLVKL